MLGLAQRLLCDRRQVLVDEHSVRGKIVVHANKRAGACPTNLPPTPTEKEAGGGGGGGRPN